ncbi:hypothetical protein PRZ48_011741 [Zasmidium cellare]|uniref:Acyltransferase 3 domain-containing protein n=1 Tax=Zasmidium cellare TaxID=395010 RepID=A0ABR0E7V1_ZASCE|nr:hypothetical protein PRZ48_011741 [Zasmidium cellare]
MTPWASARDEDPDGEERHRLLKDEEELLNGDHPPVHQFEIEDTVDENTQQNGRIHLRADTVDPKITNKDRIRFVLLLPLAYATQAIQSLLSGIRRLPSTTHRLGFFGTLRGLFNYPEPGLELRSTAWLDGLRGLAAFEVFLFHYIDGWINRSHGWGEDHNLRPEWYYAPFIRTFYASGDAAVCLFFGISGYVLSYRMLGLMRQQRKEELLTALSSAVFRRGIRLYMPVIVETFTLMMLCRYLGLPKPGNYESAPTLFAELKTWYVSILHLLLPLRYPDRWDALQDRYDGGISWTIPLEYYGSIYVYASIVFLAQVRSINVRRMLCFGMALQSFAKDDWIAAQFVMGMAFADYQLERQKVKDQPPSKRRRIVVLLIFLWGFYVSGIPGGILRKIDDQGTEILESRPAFDWVAKPIFWLGLYKDRQADRYILCFASMASLIGMGETPLLRRFLETRPVQYLGRISFGLYLCHIFWRAWLDPLRIGIISMVGLDTNLTFFEWTDKGKMFTAYILFMIPSTIVNFIFAGLFERYLDKPSVSMGRRFEKWCLSFRERSPPEAPPLQMGEVGERARNTTA